MSTERNQRIARNTGMLYFRTLLTMAASLYTSRIVLNTLGVEDYGIYNVVGGFVSILGFLDNSMAAATQRFLLYEIGKNDLPQLAKVFSMSMNIHFIIALIIFILAETVGLWAVNTQLTLPVDRMESAQWVYQFSILTFVVNVISVPYNATIIAHERMTVFAWVSIFEVCSKLLIVFMLQWSGFDKLKFYAALMCSAALIILVVYGIYCRWNFAESKFRFFWDKPLFKTLISFAAWNLWGNAAAAFYGQGINILLNIFFGPAVNAARGIAYQVQGAVSSFVQNFQMAISPQITKSFAADDLKYMHQLILQGAKYSFFLLFIVSLPILLETEIILKLWLKIVPKYTVMFTQLVIVNILIDCISGPLMAAAQASGKIKLYQGLVGGLLLLILPISYSFLKLGFPPEVTLYVSICMSLIALIARLIIISPLVQLSAIGYIKNVILIIIPVVIFSTPYPLMMKYLLSDSFQDLVIISFSTVLYVSLIIYLIGLRRNEKDYIRIKISHIFIK
jgi:O-antigen/teichoic acid export membrane protein